MTPNADSSSSPASAPPRGSLFRQTFRRFLAQKFAVPALAVFLLFAAAALVTEGYSAWCAARRLEPVYQIPHPEERNMAPCARHLLGTDYLGRDVLLRAAAASRTAIKVGLIASLLSAVLGVALGVISGYFGGWIDDIVVWIYSTFASMPALLFILAFALMVKGFLWPPLAAAFQAVCRALNTEPGMMAVYLGIGLTGWVSLCRVVRAETMRLRNMQYVTAARSLGAGHGRILFHHIIPNLMHLVIIYFTMRFAFAVMTEVIVSYLGLGVQFEPSWGAMISDGQGQLWRGIWWEAAAATGALFILVLSLNILGDALRDALDPRLKS